MIRIAFLLILVVCTCAACGMGGGLNGRAVSFYNMLAGFNTDLDMESFLSPAYAERLSPQSKAQLKKAFNLGRTESETRSRVTPEHVMTAVEGRFAYSVVNPNLDRAYQDMHAIKWVKVGRKWCLYLESEAEINAYGRFTTSLIAPSIPLEDANRPFGSQDPRIHMSGQEEESANGSEDPGTAGTSDNEASPEDITSDG